MKYSYPPGETAASFWRMTAWMAGSSRDFCASSLRKISASVSGPLISSRDSWAATARQVATFMALVEGFCSGEFCAAVISLLLRWRSGSPALSILRLRAAGDSEWGE